MNTRLVRKENRQTDVRSFEEFCHHKVMEYCDAYELERKKYQIEVVQSGVDELVNPYCYLRFESERKTHFLYLDRLKKWVILKRPWMFIGCMKHPKCLLFKGR